MPSKNNFDSNDSGSDLGKPHSIEDRVRDMWITIHGANEFKGLVSECNDLKDDYYGDGKSRGIRSKVETMWSIHLWVYCTLSAGAGIGATLLLERFFK